MAWLKSTCGFSDRRGSTLAIEEALGLCGRSLIAWVTVLALLTLAGLLL